MGRFGSLIALSRQTTVPEEALPIKETGRQLAQHVVGMHPLTVGDPNEKKRTDDEGSSSDSDENETLSETAETGNEEQKEKEMKGQHEETVETELVHQEFLLDPDLTVAEFAEQNGVMVTDFVRFQCGEELAESENA